MKFVNRLLDIQHLACPFESVFLSLDVVCEPSSFFTLCSAY